MIPQIITAHLGHRLAQGPHPLISHVAEQAFGPAHEVGSVARVAVAEFLGAVFLMRAGDQLGAQGRGAFAVGLGVGFETVVIFPKGDAGA